MHVLVWQLLILHWNYNDLEPFYVLIHFCVCFCCTKHFVRKPSETPGNTRKHPGNTLKLTRKHPNCLDLITAETVFVSCVSSGWSGCLNAIPSVRPAWCSCRCCKHDCLTAGNKVFPTLFPILSFSVRVEKLGNKIRCCITLSIPHVMPLKLVANSAWRCLSCRIYFVLTHDMCACTAPYAHLRF